MATAFQQQLKTAILHLRAEIAAIRVLGAARRLEASLEVHYRPDQPRAPSGTPEGGQWIDDPSVSAGRTRVATNDDIPGYFIDLEQEDRKGGHAHREHAGRSRKQLLSVMEDPTLYFKITLPDGSVMYRWHPAEGTFFSAGEASYWVGRALTAHPDLVEQTRRATIGSRAIEITHRFGQQTGIEAYRENYHSPVVFRPTYGVTVYLAPDPNKRGPGFRIVTAFPVNNKPNETVQ